MPGTALETYEPQPDHNGEYSWSKDAKVLEAQLGRELTPEEYTALEEKVLLSALHDSLTDRQEEDDLAQVRSIVDFVMAEHPDWDGQQIKDEVRRRILAGEQD